MDVRDVINFKSLSEQLTGSPTKIRKADTGERYADDVKELEQLLELWISWKRAKYSGKSKGKR